MARLRIKVESGQVKGAIKKTKDRALNMRQLWEDVGNDVVSRFVPRNFKAEGRPKWPPWSPKYAKWRREKKPGKILTLDGILHNSITYKASASDLLVGSNMEYAATHQFGDRKRNIPARPYLVLDDSEYDFISEEIEEFLVRPWQ